MYDAGFYDTIRPGTQASAAVIVPMLIDEFTPGRVVDVGCGEGWWAQTFANHGCEVLGLDGEYVESSPLGDRFTAHDLTTPLPARLAGDFDMAVCLEVAEHLPPGRADGFVTELCELAPVVVFSAAIPGQGGTGHINEQPIGYWVDRFQANGRTVSGALRWKVWENPQVENWYAQNLIIAVRHPELYPYVFDTPLATPWPVVHPVLFDARRPH